MALDTYAKVWNKVLLRCPMAGPFLARDWVSHAFRDLCDHRDWSFLVKLGQFVFNDAYDTGTVSVTRNSPTVTGVGTTWTSAMEGRQFRIGTSYPIYTILTVVGVTEITLAQNWGAATLTGQSYEIYNAYQTAPTDFHHFDTVWDPSNGWQLYKGFTQDELSYYDAQRSNAGSPYIVAAASYSADSGSTPGYPRFEFWPHVKDDYVIPFFYIKEADDLEDSGALLPRYVRGDILLEMALESCALWPGPSADKPNPYYDQKLADAHRKRAERMIHSLDLSDDEIYLRDLYYARQLPYPPLPWDAEWLQEHV